jgi:hypothetical protein
MLVHLISSIPPVQTTTGYPQTFSFVCTVCADRHDLDKFVTFAASYQAP